MLRYQTICVKIWDDEKFKKLTSEQQRLFLYLLTCRHSNMIGLYVLKFGYIVEDLKCGDKSYGYDYEKDLRKCFQGIIELGNIEYDEQAEVVFIKNQLKYRPVTNPNQIKTACALIKELPATPLIEHFIVTVMNNKEVLNKGLNEGLLEGLKEVLPEELRVVIAHHVFRNSNSTPKQKRSTLAVSDKNLSPLAIPKIQFDIITLKFSNVTDQHLSAWSTAYPAVDVSTELAKMEAWLFANPKNRKSNYERFIVNWLSKSQDKAPRVNEKKSGEPYYELGSDYLARINRKEQPESVPTMKPPTYDKNSPLTQPLHQSTGTI